MRKIKLVPTSPFSDKFGFYAYDGINGYGYNDWEINDDSNPVTKEERREIVIFFIKHWDICDNDCIKRGAESGNKICQFIIKRIRK